MKKWKRMLCVLLSAALVLVSAFLIPERAEAFKAVRYAWRDDLGNIILKTNHLFRRRLASRNRELNVRFSSAIKATL